MCGKWKYYKLLWKIVILSRSAVVIKSFFFTFMRDKKETLLLYLFFNIKIRKND